jgi:hypothetical protein
MYAGCIVEMRRTDRTKGIREYTLNESGAYENRNIRGNKGWNLEVMNPIGMLRKFIKRT